MNILDEIINRTDISLDEGCDKLYFETFDFQSSEYMVIPEAYFYREAIKSPGFFDFHFIAGIFDLAEVYSPSADLRFSLYWFQKKQPKTIKVSTYKESIYNSDKSSVNHGEPNRLYLPDSYPNEYYSYLSSIENWINNNTIGEDNLWTEYNEISASGFNNNEPYSGRYLKRNIKLIDLLQSEKTIPLSDLADVLNAEDYGITDEEVPYVWHDKPFRYPYEPGYFRKGRVTNLKLQKGDIMFSFGVPDEYSINYFYTSYPETKYCTASTVVVRPKSLSTSDYLFLYLSSDIAKRIIDFQVKGLVIQRLSKKQIEQIPVIEPKRTQKSYHDLFLMNYMGAERFDLFSKYYERHIVDSIEDLLNDELITKALRCRNQRAHEIIVSDIEEIKKCFEAKAFKATLIMAGSVLEAFLIDWLSELKKKDYFLSKCLIEDAKGERLANLADYINMIDEIKKPDWMKEAVKAHEIREQRNKVHAKLCLNDEEKIDAKLCEKVIKYLSQIIKTRYETDLDSKRKASRLSLP